MLHDLRKMLATVGEKLGVSSAVLRRILSQTALKADVLQRHYVGLPVEDVMEPMVRIQPSAPHDFNPPMAVFSHMLATAQQPPTSVH